MPSSKPVLAKWTLLLALHKPAGHSFSMAWCSYFRSGLSLWCKPLSAYGRCQIGSSFRYHHQQAHLFEHVHDECASFATAA